MAFGKKDKIQSQTQPDDNNADEKTHALDNPHTSQAEVPATFNDSSYAIMQMPEGSVVEMLKENMGAEQLTAQDLNRITVPTGGSTMWMINTVEGEEPHKEVEGVVMLTQSVNAYWKEPFDDTGGGTPPDCVARDGLTGIGDPSGDCLTCPLAKFESAKDGKGRGKACTQSRLVYIVPKDEILPTVIKVPPTSLANARKYLFGLTSKRQAIHSVYTKLTLETDKSADNIKYSKIVFQKTGDVESPAVTKSYADGIKPYLSATIEKLTTTQDPDS
jgi:hypothetical protein